MAKELLKIDIRKSTVLHCVSKGTTLSSSITLTYVNQFSLIFGGCTLQKNRQKGDI